MATHILLIIAILPIFLIGSYVYKKDKNKEPTRLLIKLFLGGIASCFLVLFISLLLELLFPKAVALNIKTDSFLKIIFHCFIIVALIEEGCKLLMTYLVSYKHEEFDELYDIIIYSVFTALGFAAFENILYVLGAETYMEGVQVGVLRSLLAVPGHACDGLFMGYYLSLAKVASLKNNPQEERKNIIKSLLIPTVLHGVYDLCCFTASRTSLIIIFFFIFVIAMYIISIKKLKYVATNNYQLFNRPQEPQVRYCANCGEKAQGLFCVRCGHRIQ